MFNVCSFHGLAAIHESVVNKNLDIDRYARNNGQHQQFYNMIFVNMENPQNINPAKLKVHTAAHFLMCTWIDNMHYSMGCNETGYISYFINSISLCNGCTDMHGAIVSVYVLVGLQSLKVDHASMQCYQKAQYKQGNACTQMLLISTFLTKTNILAGQHVAVNLQSWGAPLVVISQCGNTECARGASTATSVVDCSHKFSRAHGATPRSSSAGGVCS